MYPLRFLGLRIACAALVCAGAAAQSVPGDESLDQRAAEFLAAPPRAVITNNALAELLRLKTELGEPQWDRQRMECWMDDADLADKASPCPSLKEAAQELRRNAQFLARYRAIRSLPVAPDGTYPGSLFLVLSRMTAAQIQVDWREERFEDAYREWTNQHAFVQRVCLASRSWVDLAICQVAESFSLSSAEALLFHAPRLIDGHADEILALLRPLGLSRYDIAGMERRHYAWLKETYQASGERDLMLPNFIANRYYLYVQEVLAVSSKPLDEVGDTKPCACASTLATDSRNPRIAATSKLLTGVIDTIHTQVIKSMHRKSQMRSLLTMRVLLATKVVAPADISAFVAANAREVSDPLSFVPMRWDVRRRVLHLEGPAASGALEVRL
jgi:hypothetical protein